jgi:hypothetical protein
MEIVAYRRISMQLFPSFNLSNKILSDEAIVVVPFPYFFIA